MGKISFQKQKCRKLCIEDNKHSTLWRREDGVPEASTSCSTESSWQISFFFLKLYLILSPFMRTPWCSPSSLPNMHQNACQHHCKILSKRNLKSINWWTYAFTLTFLKVCKVLEERCTISLVWDFVFTLRWATSMLWGKKKILFKIFVPYADFKIIFEKHLIPVSFLSPFSIE